MTDERPTSLPPVRPPLSRALTLTLLYMRQVSANLLIYQPIFIPLLLSRGLNMLDVAYLQTAYNLGVLVLDIPAGFFADRVGRKWALALCNTSLAIGTFLIFGGHSLAVFIIAELFYAFAIAMDTGVHSAYLFEWLKEQGREPDYFRYDAFGMFLVLIIGAIGTFAAGYFAESNLALPVLLTVILTSIGIPAACLLPEKKRTQAITPTVTFTDRTRLVPRKHARGAIFHNLSGIGEITLDLLRTPGLRWALVTTIVWFWSRQYVNLIISQPFFKSIGLELRQFGMMYSFIGVASGLIALFSRRLIQRPDLRAITITGITLIPVSFGLMAALPGKFGLIGFFLYAIPYGLCTAVTNTLLNRQFHKGAERATFLSVVDFFQRLAASVLAIVLGWILARHGASTALYAAMAFTGVVAALLIPGTFEFGVDKERVNLLKS